MKNLHCMLGAICLVGATAANATTLTFNEFAHIDPGFRGYDVLLSSGYRVNGAGNVSPNLAVLPCSNPFNADPGFAAVMANHVNTTVSFGREDLQPFIFTSIGLADALNTGVPGVVQFSFWRSGVVTTQTVTLDTTPGQQVFIFNEAGVDLVQWTRALASTDFSAGQFDNINASLAPIPEPSTYALMLAGLGLVGLVAQRRRQSSPAG